MNDDLIKAATDLKAAADALLKIDTAQLVREYLESEAATNLINRWQSLHFEKRLQEIHEKIEKEVAARVPDMSAWDDMDPNKVAEAMEKIEGYTDAGELRAAVEKMDEYPDADDVKEIVYDFDSGDFSRAVAMTNKLEALIRALDTSRPRMKAVR